MNNGGMAEEAGKVASDTVSALKANPGLLFLTLVNMAFLAFVYLVAMVVKDTYDKQQVVANERQSHLIELLEKCFVYPAKPSP